ncbi:galactose mutarotase [Enterococcus sp. JM4C]|nr:aldose epimerase family protein [Enterococcus sp. JM4C]KAF1295555.1 galactose mutarotase [Enterococcus sp. JM4C]
MEIKVEPLTTSHPQLIKVTLKNDYLTASFYNYGARMHQIFAPDKEGLLENILLSYDREEDLLADKSYFGATVGPVAGRIKQADWNGYPLEKNCGTHHIHGGSNGWAYQFWSVETIKEQETIGVRFHLTDEVSGYPGPIKASVTYQLNKNSLIMTSDWHSEQTTIVNPTSHSYFNLSGNGTRDITSHELCVKARNLVVLDQEKIPTGQLLSMENLPVDFSTNQSMETILATYPEGLDDCFVLDKSQPMALFLHEPTTGRTMTVATTNQSVVLFSTTGFEADFMINGQPMHSNYGLAIEPQQIPDLIHQPTWGSIEIEPLERKQQQTIYTFSCQ